MFSLMRLDAGKKSAKVLSVDREAGPDKSARAKEAEMVEPAAKKSKGPAANQRRHPPMQQIPTDQTAAGSPWEYYYYWFFLQPKLARAHQQSVSGGRIRVIIQPIVLIPY
jgi:hypothetical protein